MPPQGLKSFLDKVIDDPKLARQQESGAEVLAGVKEHRVGSKSLLDREDAHLKEWLDRLDCHTLVNKLLFANLL